MVFPVGGLLLLTVSLRPGKSSGATSSIQVFDGPFAGLPKPDLTDRRCGDGRNGMPDMNSSMCSGTTDDGRLSITLAQVEARCAADLACVGFAQYGTQYFRPITNFTSLDNSHAGQWKTWQKHGYKPTPAPPGPSPSPPPAPPPSPHPPPPHPPPPPGPKPPPPPCDPGCQNGGTCTSTNHCSCHPGFAGQHCEQLPIEPRPKPPVPPPNAPLPPMALPPGAVAVYVDAVTGSDSHPGSSRDAPLKTLHAAQAAVRRANALRPRRGVAVIIQPGEYELSAALKMEGAPDSGSSALAPVHWWANGPPGSVLVSGGSRISGPWQRVDTNASFDVWSTDITALNPEGALDRHLFVDGVRQNRTTVVNVGQIFGSSSSDNTSFTLSGAGAQIALNWPTNRGAAGRGVEFVWAGGRAGWTEPRCAVDHVERLNSTHTRVVMMQPCFFNLRYRGGGLCFFGLNGPPKIVENAGASYVKSAHEWSVINTASSVQNTSLQVANKVELRLSLPKGSDPANASVWFPRLETIVSGNDVQHVKFTGIRFGYATWLRPGQGDGFVDFQGGACLTGRKPGNQNCSADNTQTVTPGNIPFRGSRDVSFEQCSFVHMGASAVEFSNGAQSCVVNGCHFHDISGAAVQIGSVNSSYMRDAMLYDRFNVVNNSVISQPAAELHGIPGLNVGYSYGTVLSHNEVWNTTWCAISVGYGWSRHPESWAGNNTVSFNRVHDYKKSLHDGGGIYLLGPQPGSRVSHNWVYRQIEQSMGAYYPDEGNLNTSFHDNVATALNRGRPATLRANAWWLFLWKNTIRNCPIFSNYAENGTGCWNAGSNCSMWNNTLFAPGAPPSRARQIMANSGTIANVYSTTEGFRWHHELTQSTNDMATMDNGKMRAGSGVQGFGCAAAGSQPPAPNKQPAFNPPFQHCHC